MPRLRTQYRVPSAQCAVERRCAYSVQRVNTSTQEWLLAYELLLRSSWTFIHTALCVERLRSACQHEQVLSATHGVKHHVTRGGPVREGSSVLLSGALGYLSAAAKSRADHVRYRAREKGPVIGSCDYTKRDYTHVTWLTWLTWLTGHVMEPDVI